MSSGPIGLTLYIDLSKSTQDPPKIVQKIMEKANFQPAFLVEKTTAYPWLDTLEIIFPELDVADGPTTGTIDHDLPCPGAPYPIGNIGRPLVINLDRKSVSIPTLFFVHEEILSALIAGDVYRIAAKEYADGEVAKQIEARNAELPMQTPAIERAKMSANSTRYTMRQVAEATGVSARDAQRHTAKMRELGFLPKELVSAQGTQLQLSHDQYQRVCTYIQQRNRKRGNPNLSRL